MLDWKQGAIRKLCNHVENLGFTDSVVQSGDVLLATCYDLDTGAGAVNVWTTSESGAEYVTTLQDDDTSRILSLDVFRGEQDEEKMMIVTGGRELKLWSRGGHVGGDVGESEYEVVSRSVTLFSDDGGLSESELSEEEMISSVQEANTVLPEKNSGFCNCSIM